ncbi:MAG: glycosyltransferase family 4 protein [Pisciglobus halotolerans]|nr:glycosyltransferase family 4 protein [Pisciglobus halotolerans]
MKKVLFTATVDSHILQFHLPYIEWFKEQGYEVHVASSGASRIEGIDKKYNVPFSRQPLKMESWEAYKVLRVLLENNDYDIIHCHTPMGAMLTRLAARNLRGKELKVLYTAHGFHFFKGAPLKNWMIYYPIEKMMSRYTDCLITMNQEDRIAAQSHHFKAGKITYVNGVGVDLNKFSTPRAAEKTALRKKYGFSDDAFLLIYVAELTHRKNQGMLINVVKQLKYAIPELELLLVGTGELEQTYKQAVEETGLTEKVHFLGYRKDVPQLMKLSDVAVSSSRQEGLPVNIMEAMATGLPLIATDCRGNRDLVTYNMNGFIVPIDDVKKFAYKVVVLYEKGELTKRFSSRSQQLVKRYSLTSIQKEMTTIYKEYVEILPPEKKENKRSKSAEQSESIAAFVGTIPKTSPQPLYLPLPNNTHNKYPSSSINTPSKYSQTKKDR